MTILQAFILGIVQGLTEFLPISSSAHLVLTPYLLQWSIPADEAFVFDVLVQIGTLMAVIFYFWRDFWEIGSAWIKGIMNRKVDENPGSRLGWMILIATIPAGFLGLLLKNQVEASFNSPKATAVFLFGTAFLLIISERLSKQERNTDQMTWMDALWIGSFQALSIFPGISRSGSTIAGGMMRNFKRIPAARFSFLMSLPVMLAAGGIAVIDLLQIPALLDYLPVIGVGLLTSAVVGYLSIAWLLRFLNHHSLSLFAAYCICLGLLVLLMGFFVPFSM